MTDQYAYEYEHDDYYCYPGSIVLKNKLGITDPVVFRSAERQISSLRAAELLSNPPGGQMDFAYLKRLHRQIFRDFYDWAWNARTVNISKGNHFCDALFIEDQMHSLFKKLEDEHFLVHYPKEQLAERLAYYLGEINAIHPFREGNGRTQRMFITILAARNGYRLDLQNISPQSMYEASVRSFFGDYQMMTALLLDSLS